MNKNMTRLVAIAAALSIAAGCAPRRPADIPPPPVGTEGEVPVAEGAIGTAIVPGSRADFVQSVVSDRIFFALDSYSVDDSARRTLDAQAEWLMRNPNVRVTIEGHCDERGTREYNLALGDRRANAARDYLQSRGVAAERMTTISWGKERPANEGHDESAWSQNRRAVTVVPE
ncbi:MAG TPA: peptidoglycan-associated lipoprotein Pal [Allosphingosinicella sp.]|jgi:peptidoglycan-associated lipoprotein